MLEGVDKGAERHVRAAETLPLARYGAPLRAWYDVQVGGDGAVERPTHDLQAAHARADGAEAITRHLERADLVAVVGPEDVKSIVAHPVHARLAVPPIAHVRTCVAPRLVQQTERAKHHETRLGGAALGRGDNRDARRPVDHPDGAARLRQPQLVAAAHARDGHLLRPHLVAALEGRGRAALGRVVQVREVAVRVPRAFVVAHRHVFAASAYAAGGGAVGKPLLDARKLGATQQAAAVEVALRIPVGFAG